VLEELLKWDRDTFIFLNSLGTSNWDSFWISVTEIRTWIPLFLFCAILLFFKLKYKDALLRILNLVLLTFVVLLIMNLTKEYTGRLRPCNDPILNGSIRILQTPKDFSFFSGHASTSFALTSYLFLTIRKKITWGLLFFIWPILFSYSRIYVGVHYPVDIIVGAIFGILFGYYAFSLFPNIQSNDPRNR